MKLREAFDWSKLAPLRLLARTIADGVYAGAHRSVRRGSGIEFGGHRSYVPGDDLRFLDRHARMRHGMWLVREFETETDRAVRLIVDASSSMAFASGRARASKYAYATWIAAALARVAVTRGDPVALDFVAGSRALGLPSTGGREAFDRLVGHLEAAQPEGEVDIATLERALAPTARHARRGAAVVFFSDLIDLPEAALDLVSGLSARGRSLVVVRVLDPVEIDFSFQGPLSLYSLEGTLRVETDADAARSGYLEALEAATLAWESRLIARGGRLLRAGTLDDPVEVVRRVLLALGGPGEGKRPAS